MRSVLLGASVAALLATGPVQAGCQITVNGDGIGGDVADAELTLAEAEGIAEGNPPALSCLTQAELDQISGETSIPVVPGTCGTPEARFAIVGGCGLNDADLIRFADSVGTVPYGALSLNDGDSIDGARPAGGRVTIAGPGPAGAIAGIVVGRVGPGPTPGVASVANLVIRNHPGAGIWAQNLRGNLVIRGVDVFDNGGDGIRLGTPPGSPSPDCAGVVTIGQPGVQNENYVFGNAGWGIAIYEACNAFDPVGVRVQNSFIGLDDPLGLADRGNGLGGILAFFARNVVIGGAAPGERNYIGWNDGPGIRVRGPGSAPPGTEPRVEGNWIGLARDVTTSPRPNASGILLVAGERITIGGATAAHGNVISGNAAHGIVNEDAAGIGLGGLLVQNNVIGLNPARSVALGNGNDGVALRSDGDAVVRDNVISANAGQGIYLQGSSAITVRDNVIGLRGSANTANDNTAAGNSQSGVWVDGSSACTVGPGNRVASNGGFGVRISGEAADGNVVNGNVIGLSNGSAARPNGVGVFIEAGADANVVGGAAAGDRNTISGNTFEGVRITGAGTDGSIVRNNRIGTAASGSGDLGNGSRGVRVDSGAGGVEILDNLVSGNGSDGISFEASTGSSKVQGNTIGLDAAGIALPNAQSGVAIAAASTGVLVGGGTLPNTIAANNGYGVYLADAGTTGNTVQGNVIGGGGRGNGLAGVTLRNGANANLVDDNTIIGHGAAPGIEVAGAGTRLNVVRRNRVGVDAADGVVPNATGILLGAGAHDNQIGTGGRNIVSGNLGAGVLLGAAGGFNVVEGNYIGVGSSGNSDRGNGSDGVRVEAGSTNTAIRDNTISGNGGAGIQVRDPTTIETTIVRNRIGTNAAATATVANDGDGILVAADAQRSNIGIADSPANANLVRGNAGAGIRILAGQDNRIRVNAIGLNGGLGIDLGPAGVTANDPLDSDVGANALQNFPLLTSVVRNAGMVSMTVALDSSPSTEFRISTYRNAACDPSGHGEAEAYVGEIALTTGAGGSTSATAMFPLADAIPVLAWTATATPTIAAIERGTSELGPCAVTTVPGDALFASSFESPAAAPAAAAGAVASASLGLQRNGEGSATLTLRWRNAGPTVEPAAALLIRADRAVIVGPFATAGAACELIGAIVCELAERAPGAAAEVIVPLRFGTGPLAIDVEWRDATGRLELRQYAID